MKPQICDFDFRLRCPFSYACCGSSQSGKSSYISRVLKHRRAVIDDEIGAIFYFYRTWQTLFSELERDHKVVFVQGKITLEWLEQNIGPKEERRATPLIIVDDLGDLVDESVAAVFTVGVHHYHLALFYVFHTLFSRNPAQRTITLNSTYIHLQKSPRDVSSASHLARQMDPGKVKRFMKIFREATKEQYTYLLLDMSQATPDRYRLRSNWLFERRRPMVVYERRD